MPFTIETEQETDGRWLAEVCELPGVAAYGKDQSDAVARVQALALRELADLIELGKKVPELESVFRAKSSASGIWDGVNAFRRQLAASNRLFEDSADLIREDRER
jgi:predicted RNase H-like HicB family nuclease